MHDKPSLFSSRYLGRKKTEEELCYSTPTQSRDPIFSTDDGYNGYLAINLVRIAQPLIYWTHEINTVYHLLSYSLTQ